jgi:hypothetical protein
MMTIEIAVPSSWTPGEALAMRALLQRSVSDGYPIVASIRRDVTADQVRAFYGRLGALLRDSGLAA